MNLTADFFRNDIIGIVLIGALGGVVGSTIIFVGKRLMLWTIKTFKIFQDKYNSYKAQKLYNEGYIAGAAFQSSYHQISLIGRYIIQILINGLLVISLLIIGFGLFTIIPFNVYWIVAFILGLLISFPLYSIRHYLKLFNFGYKALFDKDSLLNKKKETKEIPKAQSTDRSGNEKNTGDK